MNYPRLFRWSTLLSRLFSWLVLLSALLFLLDLLNYLFGNPSETIDIHDLVAVPLFAAAAFLLALRPRPALFSYLIFFISALLSDFSWISLLTASIFGLLFFFPLILIDSASEEHERVNR